MPADVFVSHASEDVDVANRLAAFLETCGIGCFLAPRDIPAGAVWDEAVINGIDSCAGLVLVLSARANASSFVKNEVNRAFSQHKTIFTFRVEEIAPGKSLQLYLGRHQWIDGNEGGDGRARRDAEGATRTDPDQWMEWVSDEWKHGGLGRSPAPAAFLSACLHPPKPAEWARPHG